jgi:protein phosphatase
MNQEWSTISRRGLGRDMAQGFRTAQESISGRRPENQDAVLVEDLSEDGLLLALADGMGGHAAGHVASAMALETLLKALRSGESLQSAVRLANWKVHRKAQDPGQLGMGTTLVALYLSADRYLLANVGDSRAYRISRRGIRQLTEDHSFVAEAMKRGQSEQEAMASPWKDSLTRSIGAEEEVEVDLFGPYPVEEDSAVVLCSDGLYKTLDRAQIREVFLSAPNLEEAAASLVSRAYDGGSDDNISVAIVEFGEFRRRQLGDDAPVPPGGPGNERRGKESPAGQNEEEEGVSQENPGQTPGGNDLPLPELGRAPRRKVLEPWELDTGAPPRIVGGRNPKKRSWMPVAVLSLGVAVAAAAIGIYVLYFL